MTTRLINTQRLAFIKGFEGFRLEAYKDPVGVWTIGYRRMSAGSCPRICSPSQVSLP
jgi:GH24 family phage-related lysozyme (muramidase)